MTWRKLAFVPPAANPRLLPQQMHLVIEHIRSSFVPVLLFLVVLHQTLQGEGNALALNLWCGLVLASQLNAWRLVAAFDRHMPAPGSAPDPGRLYAWMLVSHAVAGVVWGGVIWALPQHPTPVQMATVLAVVACTLGGAVSTLAPLMPVFHAFVWPLAGVLTCALVWGNAGHPYDLGLGVIGALYLGALVAQARKSARAAKGAIELRFENAQLLGQLRAQTQLADQANEAKSRLLAAASHDLMQPVRATGLFLGALGNSELSPSQRALLAGASDANTASAGMLGTLFDFARIEAEPITSRVQQVAVQHLLNKIEREFALQADMQGLAYRSRECRLHVQSDPVLLEQILRNLVGNAVRYTRRGGVLVVCRRRGSHAVFEVWDSGVGIERARQQDIFRAFYQLGNPERDRLQGFGLGLAIVQRLADALGHVVSLQSRPQVGSVFRVRVPVACHPA